MYNPYPQQQPINLGNTPVQAYQAAAAPQGGSFLGGLGVGAANGAMMAKMLKDKQPSSEDYTQGTAADLQAPQDGMLPPQGMPQQPIGQYTANPNLMQMAQSPNGMMRRLPNGNYMSGGM